MILNKQSLLHLQCFQSKSEVQQKAIESVFTAGYLETMAFIVDQQVYTHSEEKKSKARTVGQDSGDGTFSRSPLKPLFLFLSVLSKRKSEPSFTRIYTPSCKALSYRENTYPPHCILTIKWKNVRELLLGMMDALWDWLSLSCGLEISWLFFFLLLCVTRLLFTERVLAYCLSLNWLRK